MSDIAINNVKTKEYLMKELLDRYQQLDSISGCESARETVILYIKKLELRLEKLLSSEHTGKQFDKEINND